MTSTAIDPVYLNRDDAAAVLGVTRKWMATTGRELGIPSVRLGGMIRYRREQLLQWAEQQHA